MNELAIHKQNSTIHKLEQLLKTQQKLTSLPRKKGRKTSSSTNALNIIRTLKEKFSIQISKEELLNFRPLRGRGLFPAAVRVDKNLTAKLQVMVESSSR